MCRIYGYMGENKFSNDILQKVSSRQFKGGPDEQNFVIQDDWSLGNNRLSIQGLDGGSQPYYSNGIYAVFNGEIYNHKELRKILESLGYNFADTCDGTIIPSLYKEYGIDFIKKIDGMFAIAIVDTINYDENKLFVISDNIGMKSVYYTYEEKCNTLAFSSEIPSLLEFNLCNKDIRYEAINEYFAGKAIWNKNTIYKYIYQLQPSSILSFSCNTKLKLSNYSSDISLTTNTPTIEEAGKNLDALLNYEVERMLCADVPACLVTSGGLDSSYITAIASKYIPNIHSFNVSYEGNWPFDEKNYALKVAKQFNTKHHQVEIKKQEFIDIVLKTFKSIGQPNSAPHCVSTYALFEEINKCGFKFALTGEGADEMFGGYKRFINATYNDDKLWAKNYLNTLSCIDIDLRWSLYSEDYKLLLSNTDLHCKNSIKNINNLLDTNNKIESLLKFDQKYRFPYYILRRVDHLSMANSVEVRIPFCQRKVQLFAKNLASEFKIDQKKVKKVLYQAAQGKIDQSIIERPKQPFTLPITAMLQNNHPLMELTKQIINSNEFKNRNIYKTDTVSYLLKQQENNPNNKIAEAIWSIMTLELWMQINKITFKIPHNISRTDQIV